MKTNSFFAFAASFRWDASFALANLALAFLFANLVLTSCFIILLHSICTGSYPRVDRRIHKKDKKRTKISFWSFFSPFLILCGPFLVRLDPFWFFKIKNNRKVSKGT